jgi:hypothetical protein
MTFNSACLPSSNQPFISTSWCDIDGCSHRLVFLSHYWSSISKFEANLRVRLFHSRIRILLCEYHSIPLSRKVNCFWILSSFSSHAPQACITFRMNPLPALVKVQTARWRIHRGEQRSLERLARILSVFLFWNEMLVNAPWAWHGEHESTRR